MMNIRSIFLSYLLFCVSVSYSWNIVNRDGLYRTWPSVCTIKGGFLQFGGVHDIFKDNSYTFYNDIHFYSEKEERYIKLDPKGNKYFICPLFIQLYKISQGN